MRASFGCIAASDGYQVRFLFPDQLALLAWSRSLIECAFQSLLHKPGAYPAYRRSAYQQSAGNLMVGKSIVGPQQHKRSLDLTGRRFTTAGHLSQF
tara:strand:- start:9 stop:296 length:288 start_codon:yes stop_codon:yes gene_type:complete